MRIGGAFTFGQQSVPIGLAGGQEFYVPPGNYYVQLGSETLLQVFDANNNIWRNIGFPGGNVEVTSPDGWNYRLVNATGVIQALNITNAGSGGTNGIGSSATGTTIGFGAAPANGIAASAYPIVGGKLSGLTIANGGTGFVFPPLLAIDPPPSGGIQATATATISAGAINAVTLQNAGAGYTSNPNVYIVPQYLLPPQAGPLINLTVQGVIPPGSIAPIGGSLSSQPPFFPGVQWPAAFGPAITTAASITVNGITGSGTLTGAVMTQYGYGYTGTTIPSVTFSGGGLAGGVAATAIPSFGVQSLGTAGTAGVAYTSGTPWESDYAWTAGVSTDGCNGVFGARPARGRTNGATGFTGTAATVEDPGFGIQGVPNIGTMQFGSLVTTVSTTTAVVGPIFDISILQMAVED